MRNPALALMSLALAASPPTAALDRLSLRDRSGPRSSIPRAEREERRRKAKAAKKSRQRNR